MDHCDSLLFRMRRQQVPTIVFVGVYVYVPKLLPLISEWAQNQTLTSHFGSNQISSQQQNHMFAHLLYVWRQITPMDWETSLFTNPFLIGSFFGGVGVRVQGGRIKQIISVGTFRSILFYPIGSVQLVYLPTFNLNNQPVMQLDIIHGRYGSYYKDEFHEDHEVI